MLVVIIAGVIAVVNGSGKKKTPRQQARAYIKKFHHDTNAVQVSVQSVQVGIALVTKKAATQGNVDQFAQLAQQAHDDIDAVRQDFATSDDSGKLGDAETEVFGGANDLKNAMGAVVAYEGDPNPATLAHFSSQYHSAVAEWDDGIRTIWHIAGERHAPTV